MIQKILVVVDSIDANAGSGAKANIALITNLQKAGYTLRVYHYSRKDILLEQIECISIPERRWSLLFLFGRMQRLLARWTGFNINYAIEKKIGFSLTFLNDSKSIALGLKNASSFEPDLILTLSQAASFRPHHALLTLPLFHQKWMAYIHDPYPFHYYPVPYNWYQDGFKQKEIFFKQVSLKAAYSAFPSLLLKEWMGQFFSNLLKTGIVIPHQIYRMNFPESPPNFFKKEGFTLLHAGGLLSARNPTGLLNGFEQFLKQNPEALQETQLLLIGSHDYYTDFLKTYHSNPNIYITTQLDYQTSLQLQRLASVNIILEALSDISPFLPGKFPHCVLADRPILLLSPMKSETKRLLGNDYPYWSEINDADRIASLIALLYNRWKQETKDFHLNRPDLVSYCDVENLKKIIEHL